MTMIDAQGNMHDRTGQFAEKRNSPPTAGLDAEPVAVAQGGGSFIFPPVSFADEDDLVAFFVNAPLSDRLLSNADHAYKHWRTEQINDYVREAYKEYGNDPRVVREASKSPLVSDMKAQQFVDAKRREAEGMFPNPELPANYIRGILIARQIAYYSGALEGDREAVYDRRIDLGGGDVATVAHLVDEFSAHKWVPRALTDSDLAAIDATYRVARILDRKDGVWNAVYAD